MKLRTVSELLSSTPLVDEIEIKGWVRTFRANATPQTGGLTFTSQGSGGGSSSGITQSVIDQIFK